MSSSFQLPWATLNSLDRAVAEAFLSSHSGYSPDRVVADPEINLGFQEACRTREVPLAPARANKHLLGLRKRGCLTGVRCERRTSFKDEEAYRHASEVAIRHLEKRDNISLDEIICDPDRSQEFDRIAMDISPGYLPVQYRWAALNLRKSRRLKPEFLSHVVRPTAIQLGKINEISVETLPLSQGLYVFYAADSTLYVGEAQNLRTRLTKHLDHSDNKELARWFWERGFNEASLEVQELPPDTKTKVRRALEAELIKSRHPLFNVQGT